MRDLESKYIDPVESACPRQSCGRIWTEEGDVGTDKAADGVE